MGTRKPNVAYLIPAPILCGGIAVVCQHANRLARRGFGTSIVTVSPGGGLDWFPRQSVPVYPIDRMPRDIDIGVATWWETVHDLHRLDIPRKFYFVQSDETLFYEEGRCERIFARDTYRFGYEFFTEARWIRDWLQRDFGREARYVPNGVDLDIFRQDEPIAPRGERPRILIEGPADMPSKGVAAAFAAAQGTGAEVWYVNYRGEPDPSWRPARYFYRVPMAEMRRIYSSCDILLTMSTVEGASGPPLEMMACGGACVVARVTGMEEGIVEGENALVVEPGDVAGAREAVRRLIRDPSLRERLIARGRETVRRMDWERSIDILEEMFLSPPVTRGLLREREGAMIDAYACFKRTRAALERERDAFAAEAASLRRERDEARHELNSLRLSKQWKIASAVMEARRSPRALLALPVRVFRTMHDKGREGFTRR